MWCGTVEQVNDSGFVVALLDNSGIINTDQMIPGVQVGMIATFYTLGDTDEHGNAIVECDFIDPSKELPN